MDPEEQKKRQREESLGDGSSGLDRETGSTANQIRREPEGSPYGKKGELRRDD